MIEAFAISYKEFNADATKILHQSSWKIDADKILDTEVVIEALATPVNPADLAQLSGKYPSSPTPHPEIDNAFVAGNEGVFKVICSGKDSGFAVGDWVIPAMPSFGTWRTHAIVETRGHKVHPLIKVSGADSSDLLLQEAATISINPCTAYQLLDQFIKDWNKDGRDWVIQNAGNSQVSMYVTQIAKSMNIKTISIVRDGKSQQDVDRLLDFGATRVFTELEAKLPEFFSETLPLLLGPSSRVRLALNSVGGDSVKLLVSALSQDGVLATFGASSGNPDITYGGWEQLFKNITTKAYWLTANTKRDPQSKIDTVNRIVDLYRCKKLRNAGFSAVAYSGDGNLLPSVLLAISNSKKGKQVVFY